MSGVAGQERRNRRTQEERSAGTRAKLLDATIQSLIEVSYAGTTMRRVAEIAGVSQGCPDAPLPLPRRPRLRRGRARRVLVALLVG